jgi:molybdopterin synthase catalytic subunit
VAGAPDDAIGPRLRGFAACGREPIDVAAVLAAVGDVTAGGNVLFVGTARGVTEGLRTVRLVYDAHEPLAVARLDALRGEAAARFGLVACAAVHRLGAVMPGEASVAVATSAPHRAAAFEAAEWLIAAIKRDVPIWKAEERDGGVREWLHPESAPRPGGGA